MLCLKLLMRKEDRLILLCNQCGFRKKFDSSLISNNMDWDYIHSRLTKKGFNRFISFMQKKKFNDCLEIIDKNGKQKELFNYCTYNSI